jgi:phage gp29-like protein
MINKQKKSKGATSAEPILFSGQVSRSREQNNPLRSLTVARAVSLFEAAQRGDMLELQWTYHFIEGIDPILFALQERRFGALVEKDITVKVVPESRRTKKFDEKLAEDQRQALSEAYDGIDNVREAVEHLASATFKSFAHLNIHTNESGDVSHLEPLNQWNFLRGGMYGPWYWNPGAVCTSHLQLGATSIINPDEFVIRECYRHVNRPALVKYIRKSLGEKDWSAFVEIYGIPAAFLVMPENASEAQVSLFKTVAAAAAQGKSGALPYGSDVKFATDPRGEAPFEEYLSWCDKQMVIVGTGGLLTMLAISTGMNSGNADAHTEAFRILANAEALRISECLQRSVDRKVLNKNFPGKPVLAYFEMATKDQLNPSAVLDDMVKAKAAGLEFNPDEVSEKTGYTFISATNPTDDEEDDDAGDGEGDDDDTRSSLNADLSVLPAVKQATAIQDGILSDWIKKIEDASAAAKTEKDFLAAIQSIVDEMPADLLTKENVDKLALPLQRLMTDAVVGQISKPQGKAG